MVKTTNVKAVLKKTYIMIILLYKAIYSSKVPENISELSQNGYAAR